VKAERVSQVHHDILVDQPEIIQVNRGGEILDIPIPRGPIADILKLENPMMPIVPCIIEEMSDEGGLKKAGAQKGDRIISVNGAPVEFYHEFMAETNRAKNATFTLGILRGTDSLQLAVTTSEEGLFGFYNRPFQMMYEPVVIKYTILQSVPAGIKHGVNISRSYIKQLGMLFKPETRAYEELGGFIKIGSIFPSYWDWNRFWNMTAFLSIILAIMNILPIPALDGGHVMFTLFEMVSGRKPGEKFLEYAQVVGMVILASLLLYANLNDIIGLFNK
jgi:regulator of sigma E protease